MAKKNVSTRSNPLLKSKRNSDVEKNGAWFDYCPTVNEAGEPAMIRFKMRRAGGSNIEFLALMEKEKKPFRAVMRNNDGNLPTEIQNDISLKIFSEHIVVDWENVQRPNEEGAFIPYSAEEAKFLFKELPDLFGELVLLVNEGNEFKSDNQADDSKN